MREQLSPRRELEAQRDDLLRQLDELKAQLEQANRERTHYFHLSQRLTNENARLARKR